MQNMYVYSYLFIKRVDVRNKTESFIFIVRLKKPLFLAIVKYIVSSNMNNIWYSIIICYKGVWPVEKIYYENVLNRRFLAIVSGVLLLWK